MTKKCLIDLTGKRFFRLLVIKFIPDETKYSKWLCLCDCGIEKARYSFDLTSGNAKSCGCYNREQLSIRTKTHGHSGGKNLPRTRTYRSWASMMDRCHWGGHKVMYENYGAKGITVCDRWHKYENFLHDMGERPEKTSIDRINNDGNYEPSNCRWADKYQQANNTSRTIKVRINGEIVKVKELVEKLNIPDKALRSRAQRRNNDYVLALKTYGIDCSYV
ncbi:hypothetical protein [Mycoplasmopsis arginini]|uniref:hypothetical protein n=1 Tax=Mycoplasmopsis arginini TaxID=2094 RepID=UPI00249D9994|nr:hypothetical protein [Mycoplasmopsis arginini]